MSCTTETLENMNCECESPQIQPTNQQTSCSPNHHESGYESHYRRKSCTRDRKDRYHPLRSYYLDMMTPKNTFLAKRARVPSTGIADPKLWEKRYRIQRIDDGELRSRLLGCEARIEKWERAFEHQTRVLHQTLEESRQLQRCRSFWDFSSMRHCGCDCSKTGDLGSTD